jgi:hypothetical protein
MNHELIIRNSREHIPYFAHLVNDRNSKILKLYIGCADGRAIIILEKIEVERIIAFLSEYLEKN